LADLELPEHDPGLIVDPLNFLIERAPVERGPVVVSVPHYGVGSPRVYHATEFASKLGHHLAFGFADDYAAEIYGELHHAGAVVVATKLSRLFVDVNRPRDDFEVRDGAVYSRTGVVRTHSRRDIPIFTQSPDAADAELRLSGFYDPYYEALDTHLQAAQARHGHAILLDMHTANAQRMGTHQVVLGTSRNRTASTVLVEQIAAVFERHDFTVELNVPGYGGANIVRHFGEYQRPGTQAVQVEINAGLLQTLENDDFIRTQINGRRPPPDLATLARLRRCALEVVRVCTEN
jgi:N-formylglutamate amidohydrolase